MENGWIDFKHNEVVVWNGIILCYRLVYMYIGDGFAKELRKATPEELELYKKHG